MLEILDEVSTKMGDQYESAWLIDGQRMKSPLDLPIQTRIIVVSKSEEFEGVSSIEKFEGHSAIMQQRSMVGGATFVNQVTVPTVRVKP